MIPFLLLCTLNIPFSPPLPYVMFIEPRQDKEYSFILSFHSFPFHCHPPPLLLPFSLHFSFTLANKHHLCIIFPPLLHHSLTSNHHHHTIRPPPCPRSSPLFCSSVARGTTTHHHDHHLTPPLIITSSSLYFFIIFYFFFFKYSPPSLKCCTLIFPPPPSNSRRTTTIAPLPVISDSFSFHHHFSIFTILFGERKYISPIFNSS